MLRPNNEDASDCYRLHQEKSDYCARKVTLAAAGNIRRIVSAVHQMRTMRCICKYCHEAVTVHAMTDNAEAMTKE